MKVVLINPPTTNCVKSNPGCYSMSVVNYFPPINLLYLATTLKQKTKHTVKIIDADIERKDYQMIEETVKQEDADVVGVTGYIETFYDCLETVRAAKRAVPNAKICVGGRLTKFFPKEVLEHPEIDYVFLGDAEYAFPELVDSIESKKPIDKVKGIMYKKNGEIIQTGQPNVITNLDDLPFPALDFIDYQNYYFTMGSSEPVAIIIGSRGCPYQCTFCQNANSGYRQRSIQSMLNEIKHYVDNGITEFMFYDDTFNITPQRVIDFSKGILEREYKIKWGFRGRIDLINEEMFKIAKEAGLMLMSYGVEDATDEGLKQIRRMHTLEQAFRGTALAKKYNIPISVNFIIGLPTQKTKEDAIRIIKLAKKLKPDYCQFSIFIPQIGTILYEEGIKKGIIVPNFWRDYIKKPMKETYIPLWEEYLTKEELAQLIKKAYISFYFDPIYIVKTLCKVKNIQDLLAKAQVGVNLLKLFIVKSFSQKSGESKQAI